jgi:ubiquinone/menaquinone biosynthesis C-methylase UbiE
MPAECFEVLGGVPGVVLADRMGCLKGGVSPTGSCRHRSTCAWPRTTGSDPTSANAQQFWDAQAANFDEAPDHGLLDPDIRAAWASLLLPALPPPPARVADLGCGTGSITVLLTEAGFDVHGVDLSERMVAAAKNKINNAGVAAEVRQGDAAYPPLEPSSFDVVFARHVLWALPDPEAVLARWTRLLRPGGRLVLVDGLWRSGDGFTATRCQELVTRHRDETTVHLLDDPRLWGHPITDERYLLISRR